MTDQSKYDLLLSQHSQLKEAVKEMMAAQAKWDASKHQRDLPALFAAKNTVNQLINPEKVTQPTFEWLAG